VNEEEPKQAARQDLFANFASSLFPVMKKLRSLLFAVVVAGLSSCGERVTVDHLKIFAATETFPDDVFLDTASVKRALIIVAHDDDDCAMSGTIAGLTAKGWQIIQLSLQHHMPARGSHPAHIICQGNELILEDGHYRLGLDTIAHPYLPVSFDRIKKEFLAEKVADAIISRVTDFKPSVIFTLDNEKGGYGHPEHIFISQLVKDLFEAGRIQAQRIYQTVYTDHMEREIVDKWLGERMKKWGYPDASRMANEMYGITGMPEATVQVDITDAAEAKMAYLRAYDEEVRRNLRKFIPYYEEFDAKTYFGVFDREFFRVIEAPITNVAEAAHVQP
jgi:LmbE family N-acetylglucosaminyl deacetylase